MHRIRARHVATRKSVILDDDVLAAADPQQAGRKRRGGVFEARVVEVDGQDAGVAPAAAGHCCVVPPVQIDRSVVARHRQGLRQGADGDVHIARVDTAHDGGQNDHRGGKQDEIDRAGCHGRAIAEQDSIKFLIKIDAQKQSKRSPLPLAFPRNTKTGFKKSFAFTPRLKFPLVFRYGHGRTRRSAPVDRRRGSAAEIPGAKEGP